MTIALLSVTIRHDRRIRVLFTNTLAVGAFVAGLYVLTNTDGAGANPAISAALVVPNSPNVVELALTDALVAGAAYSLSAVGVPCTDTSVTPAGSIQTFFFGAPAPEVNAELTQDNLGALIFGTDLIWAGTDILETPAGDLATVNGVANFQGAINRRLLGRSGLPWRPRYGALADRFVNGPRHGASTLKGVLIRQARADDRVASATASFSFDDANDPAAALFLVQVIPVGNSQPVSVTVPAGG